MRIVEIISITSLNTSTTSPTSATGGVLEHESYEVFDFRGKMINSTLIPQIDHLWERLELVINLSLSNSIR